LHEPLIPSGKKITIRDWEIYIEDEVYDVNSNILLITENGPEIGCLIA
jgi:hypothetical protein